MGKKTSPETPGGEERLTAKQREILVQFQDEALTAAEVAMNLHADIQAVRVHLRAIVAARQLESTKVGRVVYFHAAGVRPPESEKKSACAAEGGFGEGDGPDGDEEDDGEAGADDGRGSGERSDDDDDGGQADAYLRGALKRRRPKPDDTSIEGHVDAAHAVPEFDPADTNEAALANLLRDTPEEQRAWVTDALREMLLLRAAAQPLETLYAAYERRGIPRGLLIRWFLLMNAIGETPSSIVARKPKPKAAPVDRKNDDHGIREMEREALWHRQLTYKEWEQRSGEFRTTRYDGPSPHDPKKPRYT